MDFNGTDSSGGYIFWRCKKKEIANVWPYNKAIRTETTDTAGLGINQYLNLRFFYSSKHYKQELGSTALRH